MTPAGARIRGTDAGTVRRALAAGDPLPGTRGFAGYVDGRVVRDVLGRQPVFTEDGDPSAWAFDPGRLANPVAVPAGHARDGNGEERVWRLPDPSPAPERDPTPSDSPAGTDQSRDDPIDAVETAVRVAVDEAVRETTGGNLAVAFSGGVDSGAIAARTDAPLYAAGFPGCHDLSAAREGARALGRDLRVVELGHADIERAVPEVVAATGRTNAMDVGIALPLYLAAERAAADGYGRLALGQGADELFGGYAKVARAPEDPRVEATTVRGARREVVLGLADQLERDVLALRATGVEPVAPLLDDRVVEAALGLPGPLLVDEHDERKVALRRAVRSWVPDRVAFREKKAVQYGSLVARELDRLARRAGFKRRMDDHVSRYVASLADGTSPLPD